METKIPWWKRLINSPLVKSIIAKIISKWVGKDVNTPNG